MDAETASTVLSSSKVALVLTDPVQEDNPIVYVNHAFERLTGYSSDSAVGRNCRFLQGAETESQEVEQIRRAVESAEDVSVILTNYRADGTPFLNALLITPVFDQNSAEGRSPRYFLGLQREVDKDTEKDQLAEFETALSEVQHRVKNHLSMILSLIRVKTRELEDQDQLGDISRRIESLQLLYEEMSSARQYSNEDVIQLGAYIGRIASSIAHLDGRPGVRMNVDVTSIKIETDKAARIGLIVSEILTNCMQHAFRGQETGLVELRVVRTNDGGLRVTISDDGVGMPEDIQWPQTGGLGSRVVRGLVKGLGGSIEVTRGTIGTVVIFEISRLGEAASGDG